MAAAVTALVGGTAVWLTGVTTDDTEAPSSLSPVLRQVEAGVTTDGDGDADAAAVEATGPTTVDELLTELESDGVTESFAVYLSRDPFEKVVISEVSTDGSGSGDTSGDGSDTGDGSGTGSGTDSGLACSGSGEEAVCEGTVVTMVGFTGDGEALIEVDGVRYTVGAGVTFASSFRVERLDEGSGCAFLRYGDEAFTICTGATVLK